MDVLSIIGDVESLCDDEAATGITGHLANVRHVLEQLASHIARREQAIEARTSGEVDVALGIESRADAHITQLAIDGEAMARPIIPRVQPPTRLPRIEDQPATVKCGNCGGFGQVKVNPCNGQPERLEACGECEGEGFRTLDDQDEATA